MQGKFEPINNSNNDNTKYHIPGRAGKKKLEISSIAGDNVTWNNPYKNVFGHRMFLFFDSTLGNLCLENYLKERKTSNLLNYFRNLRK